MELLVREKKVKSMSAIARSLDYSPQSLDKIKNDERNFPLEVIYKFFDKYGINPSLVFIDDLWKRHNEASEKHRYYDPKTFGVAELAVYVDIEYTLQVAMVSNENAKDYTYNHEKEEYIEKLAFMTFSNNDNDFRSIRGFQVNGDDMEPNFFHGDWVFGIRKRKLNNFNINRIYIIVLMHEIIVRRIKAHDKENKLITVSMDNYAYPDHDISLESVFEIWEFENALKTRFPMPK
ncbi:LexA family transcriptional regulator [Aquimarina latercula]|uniref:LexA family transcriptional regulator n=1 Tax=Aquimarina latercula TaxID=987 RepID=UPI0005543E25|nr:XRE family transcriptional regulator [Aquimarina latercula]